MPGMLGWFLMTEQTSLEDIEWMLAKAAGYNAGFGFVSSYEALEGNGFTNEILEQIKLWENARLNGYFDEVVREQLKDVKMEYHLEKTKENELMLQEIHSFKIEHLKKERQPGEPLFSKLEFKNTLDNQNIEFILIAHDGEVKDIRIEVDNYKEIYIPITLRNGESIKYNGGKTAIVYNENWQIIDELKIEPVILSSGDHSLTLDCSFVNGENVKLKLEVRVPGKKEMIKT